MLLLAAQDLADPVASKLAPLVPHKPRADYFGAVFEAKADTIIAVEKIPALGGEARAIDDAFLEEILRAAHAPGVKKLVLVTARTAGDPLLAKIKRDGVPYVIARAPAIAELETSSEVEGRRVLARTDVDLPTPEGCTAAQIADRVLTLANDLEASGLELELTLRGLELVEQLVKDAGGRFITGAGWKATGLQMIGVRQVVATARGARVLKSWERLASTETRHPDGARTSD